MISFMESHSTSKGHKKTLAEVENLFLCLLRSMQPYALFARCGNLRQQGNQLYH